MFLSSLAVLFSYEIPRASRYGSLKPVFSLRSMARIYRIGAVVCAYYFIFNLLTIMPRSLLEYYRGSETLGIFNSVASPVFIIQLSTSLILSPAVNIFTEAFAEGDKKKFRRAGIVCSAAVLAICLVLLLGAQLFGDAILKLLIGESIAPYTYILMPLVVSNVFLVFSSLASGILTVIRDLKGLILSAVFGLIPCAALSPALIPRAGIDGVVTVMVISSAVMAALSFAYIALTVGRTWKRRSNAEEEDINDKS